MLSSLQPSIVVLCTDDTYSDCKHVQQDPRVCLIVGNDTTPFRFECIQMSMIVIYKPNCEINSFLMNQTHLPPVVAIKDIRGLRQLIDRNWIWPAYQCRERRGSVVFHHECLHIV